MLQMKIFSFSADTGGDVGTDRKQWFGIDEALKRFDEHDTSESSFIGFVNEDDSCMQFMYLENGNLKMDIPDHEKSGSLIKEVTREECRTIIQNVYNGADMKQTPGLTFELW